MFNAMRLRNSYVGARFDPSKAGDVARLGLGQKPIEHLHVTVADAAAAEPAAVAR